MESYITISTLNDFIFCPRSIYFHGLYGTYSPKLYHKKPQKKGVLAHRAIDDGTYSSALRYKVGSTVYSNEYKLCGKIDVFDKKNGELIERKRKVSVIYDGFRYQLYAQFLCLTEMGYCVKSMKIVSMDDKKSYSIDLPTESDLNEITSLISKINQFNLSDPMTQNPEKCRQCIYKELCDVYKGE